MIGETQVRLALLRRAERRDTCFMITQLITVLPWHPRMELRPWVVTVLPWHPRMELRPWVVTVARSAPDIFTQSTVGSDTHKPVYYLIMEILMRYR